MLSRPRGHQVVYAVDLVDSLASNPKFKFKSLPLHIVSRLSGLVSLEARVYLSPLFIPYPSWLLNSLPRSAVRYSQSVPRLGRFRTNTASLLHAAIYALIKHHN